MSDNRREVTRRTIGDPHIIAQERLGDGDTRLTSFFFRLGANVYVLSYTRNGARKHTLVDAGDSRYEDRLIPLLAENGIETAGIERIVITHSHPDHFGVAHLLARESGARIVVHASFRRIVEGGVDHARRPWMGHVDPTRLSECDMDYLTPSGGTGPVNIGGVGFPSLTEPMPLGGTGTLQILACPESGRMHSPDQVIALYSPGGNLGESGTTRSGFRPTDDLLFSGDLWLMKGPLFYRGMRDLSQQVRFGLRQAKAVFSGKGMFRMDPREQDSQAKEALKRGFSLVRVEPGHGEEFLGSRILPRSLMADRDLLLVLGYPMGADTAILKSDELAPRIATMREQAYADFIEELCAWRGLGYATEEIAALLARIHREQRGGGPLVEQDRRQRAERLRASLAKLQDDGAASDGLRQVASSALVAVKEIA